MIRRPTDHFESVFNGYQLDMLLGIQNSSNPFDEFLSKPKQYLLEYLRKKPRLNIHLNMAKNGITYIQIYTYLLFKCTCIGPLGVLNKVVVFFCFFVFWRGGFALRSNLSYTFYLQMVLLLHFASLLTAANKLSLKYE